MLKVSNKLRRIFDTFSVASAFLSSVGCRSYFALPYAIIFVTFGDSKDFIFQTIFNPLS
jgi:hypothetical protein